MWICLNNAFLSIVAKDCPADCLLVRARRKGDIERVFPDAKVSRTVGNDYLYRAVMPRALVGDVLATQLESIGYSNFKNSVRDNQLHEAYAQIWRVMSRTQEVPPYASAAPAPRRGRRPTTSRQMFPGSR